MRKKDRIAKVKMKRFVRMVRKEVKACGNNSAFDIKRADGDEGVWTKHVNFHKVYWVKSSGGDDVTFGNNRAMTQIIALVILTGNWNPEVEVLMHRT